MRARSAAALTRELSTQVYRNSQYAYQALIVTQLLVECFDTLLQFYVKAIKISQAPNTAFRLSWETFQGDMSSLMGKFNQLREDLQFSLIIEERLMNQDDRTWRLLDKLHQADPVLPSQLSHRTDDACKWIVDNPSYQQWQSDYDESDILILCDNYGRGKSTSVAFMIQELRQQQLVCYHYFEPAAISSRSYTTVYRSLLRQLLNLRPHDLLQDFEKWYTDEKRQSILEPFDMRESLQKFLIDCISKTGELIYLIFDGLDEGFEGECADVHDLYTKLAATSVQVKFFVSTAGSREFSSKSGKDSLKIIVSRPRAGDHAIAQFWADQREINLAIRQMAIEIITATAEGSGLWIKLAIDSVKASMATKERTLKTTLDRLPSSRNITQVYGTIFKQACHNLPENVELLQQSLELLAVACQSLTLSQLSYAVLLSMSSESYNTLSDIDEDTDDSQIAGLLWPFITNPKVKLDSETRLSLFHQSLKKTILQLSPKEWSNNEIQRQNEATSRIRDLHQQMLRCCIKILLIQPASATEFDVWNPPANANLFDDDQVDPKTTASISSNDVSEATPDRTSFYEYSATHWTTHFAQAGTSFEENSMDYLRVCDHGSAVSKLWTNAQERYFLVDQYPYGVDPLQVAAKYGSPKFVVDMAKLSLKPATSQKSWTPAQANFIKDSLWVALTELVPRQSFDLINDLLRDAGEIGNYLRQPSILSTLINLCKCPDQVSDRDSYTREHDRNWMPIFEFLVTQLRGELHQHGNYYLRHAANQGCLPLIDRLFDAAKSDEALRTELLRPDISTTLPEYSQSFRHYHQSVGEAVLAGHLRVVRYLLNISGIDAHLQYSSTMEEPTSKIPIGNTVYHRAARSPKIEMFEILHERWPAGIQLRNAHGDTAVHLLAFEASPSNQHAKVLSHLIKQKLVDCTGEGDPSECKSPLATAMSFPNVDLCILMAEHGAKLSDVIEIDKHGGYTPRVPVNRPDLLEELYKFCQEGRQ